MVVLSNFFLRESERDKKKEKEKKKRSLDGYAANWLDEIQYKKFLKKRKKKKEKRRDTI